MEPLKQGRHRQASKVCDVILTFELAKASAKNAFHETVEWRAAANDINILCMGRQLQRGVQRPLRIKLKPNSCEPRRQLGWVRLIQETGHEDNRNIGEEILGRG